MHALQRLKCKGVYISRQGEIKVYRRGKLKPHFALNIFVYTIKAIPWLLELKVLCIMQSLYKVAVNVSTSMYFQLDIITHLQIHVQCSRHNIILNSPIRRQLVHVCVSCIKKWSTQGKSLFSLLRFLRGSHWQNMNASPCQGFFTWFFEWGIPHFEQPFVFSGIAQSLSWLGFFWHNFSAVWDHKSHLLSDSLLNYGMKISSFAKRLPPILAHFEVHQRTKYETRIGFSLSLSLPISLPEYNTMFQFKCVHA